MTQANDKHGSLSRHGPSRFFHSLKGHLSHESSFDSSSNSDNKSHRHTHNFSLFHLGSSDDIPKDHPKHDKVKSASLIEHKKVHAHFNIPDPSTGKESNGFSEGSGVHRSSSSPQINLKGTGVEKLRRSNTTAASLLIHKPKMEYNPYGILHSPHILDMSTMFGHGNKPESQLMLPYPTENPNDYLPKELQEKYQNVEEIYDTAETALIGSGGAALIKKLKLKGNPKVFVALKKFSLFRDESAKQYYRRVAQEYIVMKNFKHLHTISCYELLKLPVYMQRSWGMTMAYLPCDLFSQIRKPAWRSTSLNERLCYFKQICFGLKYLHECDIAHLDIKPDNILVAENGILRITDLGCCECGHEEPGNFKSAIKLRNKLLGTPPYQPPEVSNYKSIQIEKRRKYDPFKFDYWSLGILLFVLIKGQPPFKEPKATDLAYSEYKKIYKRLKEVYPGFVKNEMNHFPTTSPFAMGFGSPAVAQIAWKFCDPDPSTRMTLPQLFHNEYFQKIQMCIDEANYECNFVHHKAAKDMSFSAMYGSNIELVENCRGSRRLTSSSMERPIILNERHSSSEKPKQSKHHYTSLLEVGLMSRNRSDSKNSNTSTHNKGDDKKDPSLHYKSNLNKVEESEHEADTDDDKQHRDSKCNTEGGANIKIHTLFKKGKAASKNDDTTISHNSGDRVSHSLIDKPSFNSHSVSENIASETNSYKEQISGAVPSNNSSSFSLTNTKDWSKYEDAVTEDDTTYTSSNTSSIINMKVSTTSGKLIPIDNKETESSKKSAELVDDVDNLQDNELHPADIYSFIYPDGRVVLYEFDDEDYKNVATEYMVVNYKDIKKSTEFTIKPHSHSIY
ncbi:hypothetical protein HII13_002427 [Brettanomyces bruxellensis]|nr:hypothetical protein HII13_002427 [Brettanomyces bruxellensis]